MTHSRYAGLFLLTLVGCFEQNDALTPPLVENAELLELDVFAVVIMDAPRPPHTVPQLFPMNARPTATSAAATRTRDRNRVPLRLDIPYRWITAQEIRDAKENPYRSIRPLEEALTIGLSQVGFSLDYRKAFVYVAYECGALCGAGNFVLLERDATSVCHITRKYLVWVA